MAMKGISGINIIALESENLTGLGGPMGTETTSVNWTKYYTSEKQAMDAAVDDYRKAVRRSGGEPQTVVWTRNGGRISSSDLGFVMYHVYPIQVSSKKPRK